jgi:hypothetical protein
MDAVNNGQDFELDNPELKVFSDHIWSTLAGAPKTGLGVFLDQPGPHAILASEAEYAMMRAATQRGPGFDPHKWWANNQDQYMTKQVKNNVTAANKLRLSDGTKGSSHIVTDADGNIDRAASTQKLTEEVESGTINETDAAMIVDDILMGVQ